MSPGELPAPPRTVVATHSQPVLKAVVRLSLAVVFVGAVVLWVALLHELVLRGLGTQVQADVISVHERPGKDGGAYTHRARYRYSLGGSPRTDESGISWNEYRRLTMPYITPDGRAPDITISADAPATTGVRAYEFGPLAYSRAVEHQWGFMYLLIPALFAPTGTLLLVALYVSGIVRPRQHKWLYTDGSAVAGVVTGRRTSRHRYGVSYLVCYNFAPHGGGVLSAVAMVPGPKEFDAAADGQRVTILYNPQRPRRSTIYEYCGFRCA